MKFEYVDVGKYFSGSSPTLLAIEAIIPFIKEKIVKNSSLSYVSSCEILARQLVSNGITHLRVLASQEFIATASDDVQLFLDTLKNSDIQSLFLSKGKVTDVLVLQSHAISCPLLLTAPTENHPKAAFGAATKAGFSVALISARSFITGERLYCFSLLHNLSTTLVTDSRPEPPHLEVIKAHHPDALKCEKTAKKEAVQTFDQDALKELMRLTPTHHSQRNMTYKQVVEDLDPVKLAASSEGFISRLTPQEIETRREQRTMKRISTYASSLHGASSCFNVVLRAETASTLHTKKPEKKRTSTKPSKADLIRQENEQRLREADIARQQKVLAVAVDTASTGRTLDAKLAALEGLRLDRNTSLPLIYCSFVIEKIRIYSEAWKNEVFRRSSALATSTNNADFAIAIDLFEDFFSIIDDEELLAAVTSVQLETVLLPALAMFGFIDAGKLLIHSWLSTAEHAKTVEKKRANAHAALERAARDVMKYKVRHSFIRFQLLFCGHLGSRGSKGPSDPRVRFLPDPWQQRLLDAVDERVSALICAPTASGKTFICYYAMEQTLRRSDTGVVLYIAPNKALMDQVVADVYARFNHKQYPKGSTRRLFGYLTDVDSFHAWDAQILVTFPEVVERFIMSPLFATWRSNLEWVILDEIHTIGEEGKCSSWEKILLTLASPILALSATIGNKSEFYEWINRLQAAAGIPCRMIDHLERYSDLQYHLYAPGHAELSSSTGSSKESTSITSVRRQTAEGGQVLLLHPLLSLSYEDLKTNRELPSDFYLLSGDAVRLWDALWALFNGKNINIMTAGETRSTENAYEEARKRLQQLNYENLDAFKNQLRLARASMRLYARSLMELVESFVHEDILTRGLYLELQRTLGADVFAADGVLCRHLSSSVALEDVDSLSLSEAQTIQESHPSNASNSTAQIGKVEQFLQCSALPLLATLGAEGRLPAIIFHFDRSFCTQLTVHIIEALEHAEAVKRQRSVREDRHAQTALERSQRAQRRARDQEKKTSRDSWIEESMEMESMSDLFVALARNQGLDPEFVFYDQRYKVSDENLREMLEENGVIRAMTSPIEKILLRGIFRGIGVHHQGLPKRYLAMVEHLFRLRHLQVVVAGATLALGINMPVRTVVFGASSITPLSLTPLDFRQAAGRAGRRNYDAIGHVIFWGFSKSSIDALLTSKIPSIRGDVAALDGAALLQAYHLGLPEAGLFLTRALTVPLSPQLKDDEVACKQMFLSTAIALERFGLLDAHTQAPTVYSRLALLAPGHASAAIILGHLMRLGWLDLICSDYHQRPDVILRELLLFICRFVQRHYLPADQASGSDTSNTIRLPVFGTQELQQRLEAELIAYNSELLELFGMTKNTPPSSFNFVQGALVLDAVFSAHQIEGVQGVGLLYSIPPDVIISGYIYDYFLHADISRINALYGISEMALWRHLNDFKTLLVQLHQMIQREPVSSQSTQQAMADLVAAFDRRFRLMWA